MSRLFSAVRFGVVASWLLMLIGVVLLPASAQGQTTLTGTLKVANKQVAAGSAMTPYIPIEVTGGTKPYNYVMTTPLPDGLQLNAATGEISGTPTTVTAEAGYAMRVTDANNAGLEGTFFLEVLKPTTPITSFTISANPSFVGANVTLRAEMAADVTGTISFYRGGFATKLGEGTLTNGVATIDTAALVAGTYNLFAVFSGNDNYSGSQRALSVTVVLNNSQITLQVDKTRINTGQAVTLTAQVTPNTITGQVTFKDGTTDIGQATIVNGTATLQTAAITFAGPHNFTAEFPGDAKYDRSVSGNVTVTVVATQTTATTLELVVDKAQTTVGDRVVFTASLKAAGVLVPTATGNIILKEGGAFVGAAQLVEGKATISISTLALGTHTLTAEYAGDANYSASKSGNVVVNIVDNNLINTTTKLTASKSVAALGDTITFTATVTPNTATGQVRFMDSVNGQGAVAINIAAVNNGVAVFTTKLLGNGVHSVTAIYEPQGQFNTSTSDPVTVTVGTVQQPANTGTTPSTTTLTVDKTTSAYGEAVRFSVTVTPNTATGTVTIYEGTTPRGTITLGNDGTGSTLLNGFEPGTRTLYASYNGSNVYAASKSADVTITVGTMTATMRLVALPRQPAVGQTYEVRALMTPTTATGKVTFKEGDTTLGDVAIVGGIATLRVANAILGDHSYTATYAGDGRVDPANANLVVTVVANKPSPTSDPSVRAMVSTQLTTATRMSSTYMGAVHLRLETLHDEDVPAFSNGISFSQAGNLPSGVRSYENDQWVAGASATPAGRSIDTVMRRDRFEPLVTKDEPLTLPRLTAPRNYHIWTAGSVMFGGVNYTGLGTASRTSFTLSALTAGIDAKIADGLRAGFAVSYSAESSELGGGNGDTKTNMMAGSLYASWRVDRNVFIDTMLGYGFANFQTSRMDPNLLMKLPGRRSGQVLMASIGASYDEKVGNFKFAPYGRMDLMSINLGGYSEQGDANWSLIYQSMRTTAQSLVLGLRGQIDYERSWGVLSPFGRLEYRHSLGVAGVQTVAYAGDPGSTYTISAAAAGSDSLTGGIGVKAVDRKRLAGSLEYSLSGGQSGIVGQGLRGSMRLGF